MKITVDATYPEETPPRDLGDHGSVRVHLGDRFSYIDISTEGGEIVLCSGQGALKITPRFSNVIHVGIGR